MSNQRKLMILRKNDGSDRISILPDNLKESILDRISIKDAARTSILSSKWGYKWTARKRLDFGEFFVSLTPNCTGKKYVQIIHRILFLHHGPIEHVSLHIPVGVRDDAIDLDAWLLILARKGIQELHIDASGYLEAEACFFSLCSSLFQCHSLKYLKLSCCELKPPSDFCGFFSLVALHLHNLKVSSYSLGSLISKCRKLENLCLMGTSDSRWYYRQPLVFNAPNLRALEFKDDFIRDTFTKNVPSFGAVSLAQFLNLYVPVPVVGPKVYRSFDHHLSWSGIEKLDLDLPLVKPLDGECPDYLPVLLMNLKSLKLFGVRICKREDIAIIFCLIRSAPCLETLHIELYQESSFPPKKVPFVVECLEVEGRKANNLGKLVGMKIGLSHNSHRRNYEPMSHLIRILLSNCPVLETLYVAPDWQWEPDAMKLNWATKLLRFRRLSSSAEIIIC
uniref:F-box domain-containing protein n=1 Tax=Kalanchoe fedtschenkoi TaxID=63787 RepID=A0A7N0VC20_KALFE